MMADKKSVDAAATGTTADCTSGTSETKVRPDVHGGDGAGAGLTRQDDIVDIAAMTHTGRFPIGHYSPRHVADSPQDGSVAAQSVNQWPRERASSIQLPAPLTPPVYSELPVTASLTAAGSSDVLPVSSKAEVVVGLLQQVAIARNPSSASSGSRRKLTTAEAAGRQPIESATECSSEEALNSVSAARAVTVTGGSVECLPSHSTLYSGNRVASSEALTRPSSNCITAAIIHVDSDGDATRFSQRRTEGEPFLPPPPSYNVASAMPTRGGHCRLVQHQSFNRQHSTPASLRHHQLFGSSSVIYRRKRVLEVPFDENNVPQIDRAVTPPPGLSFSYSSTASALAHAAAAVDQTSGTVSTAPSEMSPLQTATLTQTVPAVSAGISGFAAGPSDSASTTKKQTSGKTGSTSGPPPIYARRFASLRIPARSGKSKGDRCGGEVTALVGGSAAARINGSQLYRTSTLAGVRSRSNTSGHGAELNSNYGSQLSVSSALSGLKTQDCRYAKMQLLQNIGDDISLYGTPKEELSPTVPPKSVNFANDLRDQLIAMFQPSDNKLAMKLFGNKNALLKEKMRQKAVGKWVIHPCSNFRFYWDVVMLVLLIANLIILPVAISFFNDDLSVQWIVFNGLSDTVFMLDLVINFRTGIIADNFADEIILEPHEIARRYLRSWFLLDLVSSIPLDYFILLFSPDANLSQLIHAGRALKVFRLVKLLSLLRLLRLSRLVRYVSQWEEFLTVASKFMRIFNLVCLILLLGHWNGCLQWLVPMLQDFPSNSWPALEELQHADWLEQYTWALFKALSHMLCIGFGRYPPQSTTDVWLTMISMLTGATCYALFVGHSTTLIQSFDTSKRLYREKFKQVEEYMAYRKLHRDLRQKISDYYEHRFRGKMFDEKRILEEVNECLKEEIVNYNCRALVAAVPFFTHADPNFVTDVVTKLEYEVFQPGDYIIKEGTVGTKMYFIQEGIVDIVTKNGEVATSLSDGSYFGEICLLTNSRRVASVRAESYCSLFSLSVDQFHSVLEHYPVMRRTLESVAAQRLNKIGKNPSIVSTREDFEDDINTVNELLMHGATDQSSVEGDDGSQEQEHDRAGKKRKIGSSKDSSGKLLLKFPLALKKKRHSHDDSSGHDDV